MKIFYNVDTQKDFMNETGALYVPGAEAIKPILGQLHKYARSNDIPMWGQRDRHFKNDAELIRNGGVFPDHCMDGTDGMNNISETVYSGIIVPHRLSEDVVYTPTQRELRTILVGAENGESIMLEKQHYDVFTNPLAETIFREARVTGSVVFGVATEYCDKTAALGMRNLGIEVYIVKEAIEGITNEGAQAAIDEMDRAGCKFVNLEDVLEGRI